MSKPRKLPAMDLLVRGEAFKPALSQSSALSRSPLANLRTGAPVEIPPEACRPWRLADRPDSEAAHKDELVESFRRGGMGQIQPIVVRPAKDPGAPGVQYEVVCGRVRWLAAKELGVPVQAIVRELDDRQAYALMSAENRQRRNLSDYAKARSYRQALALGVFGTAGELAEAVGVSKSRLSQYLGFAELPGSVAAAFADIAKLSYRTGYELNKACRVLGEEAAAALAPRIESGELSRDGLRQMQARAAEGGGRGGVWGDLPEAPPPAPAAPPGPPPKTRVVSSAGRGLFTYNPASRGWLIRIAPDVSQRLDEGLMLELGRWLEARLGGGGE